MQTIAEPTSAQLKRTHHTLDTRYLDDLREGIEALHAAGVEVIEATGIRAAVPNSYRSAYKLVAPFWHYSGGDFTPVDGKLENRPRGVFIPARFTIRANEAPEGFRCFGHLDGGLMFVRRK